MHRHIAEAFRRFLPLPLHELDSLAANFSEADAEAVKLIEGKDQP